MQQEFLKIEWGQFEQEVRIRQCRSVLELYFKRPWFKADSAQNWPIELSCE